MAELRFQALEYRDGQQAVEGEMVCRKIANAIERGEHVS